MRYLRIIITIAFVNRFVDCGELIEIGNMPAYTKPYFKAIEAKVKEEGYKFISFIGSGMFGYVFLAESTGDNQLNQVAIKIVFEEPEKNDLTNFPICNKYDLLQGLDKDHIFINVPLKNVPLEAPSDDEAFLEIRFVCISIMELAFGDLAKDFTKEMEESMKLENGHQFTPINIIRNLDESVSKLNSMRYLHNDISFKNILIFEVSNGILSILLNDFDKMQFIAENKDDNNDFSFRQSVSKEREKLISVFEFLEDKYSDFFTESDLKELNLLKSNCAKNSKAIHSEHIEIMDREEDNELV